MCKMEPPKKLYKGMAFTIVLLSSLWLVACGGGSSRSDNNDTNNTPNVGGNGTDTVDSSGPLGFDAEGNLLHTTIPSVSELTTDANYQGFLFYSVAAKNNSSPDKYTLKAVNPSLFPITSEIITTNIQKMDFTSVDTVYSFPAANISNGKLSGYSIDRMMFLKKTGTSSFDTRVVSSTGTWPPTPQTLTLSSGQDMPGMVVNYAFQHNLIEPQNSTFSYVDNSSDFNRYITTINPNNNTDKHLNKKLTPIASLVTAETHSPNGWIVGDFSSSNSKLYEYSNDGSLRGELTNNGVAIENVVTSGDTKAIPGTVFADGSQLLAIHQIDQNVDPIEVIRGKRQGADDYLIKPIDYDLLLATVEARLRQVGRIQECIAQTPHLIDAEKLVSLYGLTPTEVRVTLALSDGLAIADVAKAMNVARTTAVFHLRNIFQKTAVSRQAELVALVMKTCLQ